MITFGSVRELFEQRATSCPHCDHVVKHNEIVCPGCETVYSKEERAFIESQANRTFKFGIAIGLVFIPIFLAAFIFAFVILNNLDYS